MNDALPEFSIGIVNYKTLELTRLCLELLKSQLDAAGIDRKKVDVWVVDNHSRDGSVVYLRSLDWINLIERAPTNPHESGSEAHGRGLNLILDQVKTDYLFLMHTDTFIHDPAIFRYMLNRCQADEKVVSVGCLHQVNRGHVRMAWRTASRFVKHQSRKLRLSLGMRSKAPQPYREEELKSFFTLWRTEKIKASGYSFFMNDHTPTYQLQHKMKCDGYKLDAISPAKIFSYLDHCEAGTVCLRRGYDDSNRRVKRKELILQKIYG